MSKAKRTESRELEDPMDIRTEEDVLVGWDSLGRKFMINENEDDGRIHQIIRCDLIDMKQDVVGFGIEIKRFAEPINLVEIARQLLLKDLLRVWVFDNAMDAMSWFSIITDDIIVSKPSQTTTP